MIYINNIKVFYPKSFIINNLKVFINIYYKLYNLGEVKQYLEIEINQVNKMIIFI